MGISKRTAYRYFVSQDHMLADAALESLRPEFAKLLGVSKRTLEQWEQGRRQPSGAAKTLLRVAELHPEALRDIAA